MHNNTLHLLTALLLTPLAVLHATERYVTDNGHDTDSGTFSSPFQTIQRAFENAGPADTIVLHKRTYRAAVSLSNQSGKDGAPITQQAYKDEKSIISGLDVLKLDSAVTDSGDLFIHPLPPANL